MLLLIIGLAIAVLGINLTFVCNEFAYMLVFMVGIIISAICTNQPLSGWVKGKIIKQYPMVPLIKNTNIYGIWSRDGYYTYKYVSENGEEIIKCTSVDNTLYVEEHENQEPTFVIREKKAKKTLWAFPIGCTKWMNILYVPKDSIK